MAVEHEFVLAAHQVQEYERQGAFAHALPRYQALALLLLAHLVGRGIDDQQDLCTGLLRQSGGLGLPDVLTHEHAGLDARNIDDGCQGARREVALFIEDTIVRQAGLAVGGKYHAVANHDCGVMDLLAGVLRVACDQGDAAHFLAQSLERARDLRAHAAVKQQVLGWIAGDGEFRQQHHICPLAVARRIGRLHDPRGVSVDVADHQVQLRHHASQPSPLRHG